MLKNLFLFVFFLLFILFQSQAATNISGQIRTDTTWTKAGSPYITSGLVEIATGVTLTVEPGVTIIVDTWIDIYGDIILKGTSTDSIYLKSKPGVWWGGLRFHNYRDTIMLDYCRIDETRQTLWFFNTGGCIVHINHTTLGNCLLTVPHGNFVSTVIVENTSFLNTDPYYGTGITISGIPLVVLEHNIVEGAIMFYDVKTARIHHNFVSQASYGIRCDVEEIDIAYNVITNTTDRALDLIRCKIDPDKGGCRFNIIADNKGRGLNINSASGFITQNTIYNNGVGITHSFYPGTDSPMVFKDNCIYDNQVDFKNVSGADYHIAPNWWGTVDSATIDSNIFDYIDDFKLGRVNFTPVLQQADTGCKKYSQPTVIEHTTIKHRVSAYPNPFDQSFTIKSPGNIKHVIIYNLVGKQMARIDGVNSKQVTIDAAQYPKGVYVYNVFSEEGQPITGKLVKQ